MSTLVQSNVLLPAGTIGYVEASFFNEFFAPSDLLTALNGPIGLASGCTFTDVSTPITQDATGYGTTQFSYIVNSGYSVYPQSIIQSVQGSLQSIPTLTNLQMGNVYTGSPNTTSVSSVLTTLGLGTAGIAVTALLVIIAILLLEQKA